MCLFFLKAEELKKLKDIEEEQGTTQEVTTSLSPVMLHMDLHTWAVKDDENIFAFQSNPPRAKYEIEAENRELSRMLEKRSQEVENLSGIFMALLFVIEFGV